MSGTGLFRIKVDLEPMLGIPGVKKRKRSRSLGKAFYFLNKEHTRITPCQWMIHTVLKWIVPVYPFDPGQGPESCLRCIAVHCIAPCTHSSTLSGKLEQPINIFRYKSKPYTATLSAVPLCCVHKIHSDQQTSVVPFSLQTRSYPGG